MSRIIIADIHGCYNTLVALIAKLPKDIPITIAGDLVDRGPDSNKVIKFVRDNGYDCVVGNHEIMMVDNLMFRTREDGTEQVYTNHSNSWFINGGSSTLNSYFLDKEVNGYRVHDITQLKSDIEWIKTLPYYIHYENEKNSNGESLLVTHTTAAEVWGQVNHNSTIFKDTVTWDRNSVPKKIPGVYNVYGHTPQIDKVTIKEHFACIDTGAFFKNGRYGKMSALQWPEMIVYEQENIE